MAKGILDLNDGNFDETVASGVVLVDFWAPWCGPCKMQTPVLEQMVDKVEGKAVIAKVNVDEAPQTAGKYGIRSIPTILIFKNGAPVQQMVGLQQEGTLISAIEDAG